MQDNLRSLVKFLSLSSMFLLVVSTAFLPLLDKSSFNSAFSVVENLPPAYWLGVAMISSALILCLFIKDSLTGYTVLCVVLSVAYIELPRLMYVNAFQMECFHQAQIYHVLNTGSVTDPDYPFPVADVAHAIFSAVFIDILGLKPDFLVSHVLPFIFRLVLSLAGLCLVTRNVAGWPRLPLLISIPLYIAICDTEPSFSNHYIFVLPLYTFLTFLTLSIDERKNGETFVLFVVIFSAIVFSHIYFATLIAISIFIYAVSSTILKRFNHFPSYVLTPIVIFLLWHGYLCEWSIEGFFAEINSVLLPAMERFASFEINLWRVVEKTGERFGSISVKADYQSMVWLKWLIIFYLNLIMLLLVAFALIQSSRQLGFKRVLRNLLSRNITYLWLLSTFFLVIFAFTTAVHPQRVLEAFIIPNCGFTLMILKNIKYANNASQNVMLSAPRKIFITALSLLLLLSVASMPLKVVSHWSTALTYIGFTKKSITQIEFLAEYGNQVSIHYIGFEPYYFLKEILSTWPAAGTYSLNGPEGDEYFNVSISNINQSLAMKNPHYIYFSISNQMSLNAKYAMEQYFSKFIDEFDSLKNKANVVYMNSVTESICYIA